ncbi:hypothetical protein Pla22_48170 [Rubripirellula amarantea]|uniref:Uncharacterized protein n=1 Tax=Rubripirellula amarantea TaxID=2527999 RepID=A0A5C5WG46_9BACT|nr:hypothetical protein [Rubripirellula amarantea]TWT49620.1 hypothetical protein Pla22_48170 [Rubripirellula amarantea]
MKTKQIWIIHIVTLIAFPLWIAVDPSVESIMQRLDFSDAMGNTDWFRFGAFSITSVVAAVTLIALFARMLGRSKNALDSSKNALGSRSIRQLFVLVGVIAIWCSVGRYHQSIAWQGKRIRFASRVDQLEAIASTFRDDWPTTDGQRNAVGPFMAYPFGRPTTLVLLEAPRIESRLVYISAIERCANGAIKLQLTGTDGGDWAEWHPPNSRPSSFIGGLSDPHELETATSIGRGWFLVRYRAEQPIV